MTSTRRLLIISLLILISLSQQVHGGRPYEDGDSRGFTVDLIHRDSPFLHSLSSFNINPDHSTNNTHKFTKYDMVNRAIHRSHSRHRHFSTFNHNSSTSSSTSPLFPGASGEFIMNITIGNPPSPFLGFVDTGSNIIWTQCKPCVKCYQQNLPIYDPRVSSTYNSATCTSSACNCNLLTPDLRGCNKEYRKCTYNMSYADGTVTVGDVGTETLNFGGKRRVPGVVIGCGHYEPGTLDRQESGLIGLAGGALSLIGQTLKYSGFGGRFSQCLISPFGLGGRSTTLSSGRISFGNKAIVSGYDVVTTPLRTRDPNNTLYYVTLESISVGEIGNTVPYLNKKRSSTLINEEETDDNMFLDSGTTITYLKEDSYHKLVSKIKEVIQIKPVDDTSNWGLDLCYPANEEADYGRLNFPTLTFHFAGKADVELKPSNMFAQVAKGFVCLGIKPSHEMLDRAIFGSLSQMGYIVGFDLEARTVSFKPTLDCSTT